MIYPIDTNNLRANYFVDLMNAIETAGMGDIFSDENDGPNNEGVKAVLKNKFRTR